MTLSAFPFRCGVGRRGDVTRGGGGQDAEAVRAVDLRVVGHHRARRREPELAEVLEGAFETAGVGFGVLARVLLA
jgi:hypothetical protein